MIGLLGAHRTGKTTLAQYFAPNVRNNGAPMTFVETNVSKVFRDHGSSARQEYDFAWRLKLQNAMLDQLEECYQKADTWFITDRTPLDVLAYTLAEVGRTTLAESGFEKALQEHTVRAFEITNTYLEVVALIQPGIPIVDAPGKAPPSFGYIQHLNMIMRGLVLSPNVTSACYIMPQHCLDLSLRASVLGKFVSSIIVERTSDCTPYDVCLH